jgi:hypothetical protein
MKKKLLLLTVLVATVAACAPAQATPSSDVALESRVNTAVAGTMEANQRIEEAVKETVAAQGSSPAAGEDTSSGSASNISLLLTPTLVPTDTPFGFSSPTPTFTPIPLKYTCSVYKKKPKDNEVFNKNEEFDVKFTVTNTGTRTWPKGIDFKYVSGTVLAGPKRVEIPKALAPWQTYDIVLDGKAPDHKGFYVMTFFVDGPMCYGYIAINVK